MPKPRITSYNVCYTKLLRRLIYGADTKTGGRLFLHGKEVEARQPKEALDLGIVYLTEDRKAQGVFLDMSVHDNLNLIVCNRDAKAAGILDREHAKASYNFV